MNKNLFRASIMFLILVLSISCTKNEVKTLSLNKSTSNLILGETDSLKTSMTVSGDINKLPQTWTSSNLSVVTVNKGLIQAVKAGTSIITVAAGDKSVTCQVTVTDQIVTQFTGGNIDYWADYYQTSLSNDIVLSLFSTTDTLMLEVNTPLTVTDSISSGTYAMISNLDLSSFSQFVPFTLLPAFQLNGSLFGSWFYNKRIFTPVMQGSISNVLKNNVYSIQYNLFDYFGNSISGTFSGFISYTKKASAPAFNAKRQMKYNNFNIQKYKLTVK